MRRACRTRVGLVSDQFDHETTRMPTSFRLLQALDAVRSPEEVATARGRTVIRVNPGQDYKKHSDFGLVT